MTALLLSTDGERFAGGLEQDGAPGEQLEPGGGPAEEAEELPGDIRGDSRDGREWRSCPGRPGVHRLCPK